MKKYILKDKVLYDWLCENSDDFDKEFQKACAQGFENTWEFVYISFLPKKTSVLCNDNVDIAFKKIAIDFEEVYDPHAWNDYPEMMPPEGVLMRVENVSNGILHRSCAIFGGANWHLTADGHAVYSEGFTLDNVKRFRPWED